MQYVVHYAVTLLHVRAMDLDALIHNIHHAFQIVPMWLFVNNNSFSIVNQFFVRNCLLNVSAEALINGDLYTGTSTSSDQPRVGQSNCLTCTSDSWPDVDGQRFTFILN